MKELDFYCQRCGEKHEDQHPDIADLYNFIKLHYNECGEEGIKIKPQLNKVKLSAVAARPGEDWSIILYQIGDGRLSVQIFDTASDMCAQIPLTINEVNRLRIMLDEMIEITKQ